jgi:hypothetical protein
LAKNGRSTGARTRRDSLDQLDRVLERWQGPEHSAECFGAHAVAVVGS